MNSSGATNDLEPPLVDIEGLQLAVGGLRLIDGLSVRIATGSRLGVTGPSGCGKTTLLRSIVRRQLSLGSSAARFHVMPRPIAYSPQTGGLLPWSTARSNIGLLAGGSGGPLERRERQDAAIESMELEESANRPTWQLSSGEKQRARLGAALAVRADLFCADEPLTEVGLRQRWRILEAWSGHLARWNTSLLIVSHDVDTLLYMCDRILVLDGMHEARASQSADLVIEAERHPRSLESLNGPVLSETRKTLIRRLYR